MSEVLFVLNSGAVGLYGAILSASFCDIKWDRKNKNIFLLWVVILGSCQAFLFVAYGGEMLRMFYPIVTHVPLMILLGWMSRGYLWGIVSVLTAYQCCQLRRWVVLFVVEIFQGGEDMQAAGELLVSIPLLVLIMRFASPAVREVSRYPLGMQLQFGLIPAVGYAFDYLTRVYTDWLVKGVPVAVEFMPFVCAGAYLIFILYSAKVLRRQGELEQAQAVMDLQVKQASQHILDMKKSQELAASYRHDLRHHLQYVDSCLENGSPEQAREYIRRLNEAITEQVVENYCANTAANLILSVYAGRARENDVVVSVHMRLPEKLAVLENDLCVLLSNSLENALHACVEAKRGGREAGIEVRGYEKEGKIFLEIANTCHGVVEFEDGIPVNRRKDHGIGVRSICSVVEKYGGIYDFEQENGRFILRMSL